MSRSGYWDDCDYTWGLIRWRGAVESALRGKRGQAFLRELIEALDALPTKALTTEVLVDPVAGECCAMGAVALRRGLDVSRVDPFDRDQVADVLGIAGAMAAEISHLNDDAYVNSDAQRWEYMRAWATRHLAP